MEFAHVEKLSQKVWPLSFYEWGGAKYSVGTDPSVRPPTRQLCWETEPQALATGQVR